LRNHARGIYGCECGREREKEGVTLAIDLRPTVTGTCVAHYLSMNRE
jgi:hypothetical protein